MHKPVKSIKHFYCDKNRKSHGHGMKIVKNVTLNTNKACRIRCTLHVVCLKNGNKTSLVKSQSWQSQQWVIADVHTNW